MYVGFYASKMNWVEEQRLLTWSFSDIGPTREINTANLRVFEPESSSKISGGAMSGIIVGCFGFILICVSDFFYLWWRNKKLKEQEDEIEAWELEYWPHRISYEEFLLLLLLQPVCAPNEDEASSYRAASALLSVSTFTKITFCLHQHNVIIEPNMFLSFQTSTEEKKMETRKEQQSILGESSFLPTRPFLQSLLNPRTPTLTLSSFTQTYGKKNRFLEWRNIKVKVLFCGSIASFNFASRLGLSE